MTGLATAQEMQALAESLRGVSARLKSITSRLSDDLHLLDAEEHETRVAVAFAEVSGARQMTKDSFQEHKDVCSRAEAFARKMEHGLASARNDSPLPPNISKVADPQQVRAQRLRNAADSIGEVHQRPQPTTNTAQAEHELSAVQSKIALSLPLLNRHDGLWRFALPSAPFLVLAAALFVFGAIVPAVLALGALVVSFLLSQRLRVQLRSAERVVAQRVEKMVDSSKTAMNRALETISHAENDVMAEGLSTDIVIKIEQWRTQLPPKPDAVLGHLLKGAEALLLHNAAEVLDPMEQLEWETLTEDTLPTAVESYLQLAVVSTGQSLWTAEQELLTTLLKIYDEAVTMNEAATKAIDAKLSAS